MTETPELAPCPDCGAMVPTVDGATHRYIGASAGCWEVFGDILARQYTGFGTPRANQLVVDAYAAQHPGEPSPQSIQSVAVHLISLFLQLELNADPSYARRVMQAQTRRSADFEWLDPPRHWGNLTILDVRDAANTGQTERFVRAVEAWASSVWIAWSDYHEQIRFWAGE